MVHGDTKQRILEEALRLFAMNGYEAVSVEHIAKATGIKAPSLYKHYKSKRDIFEHIVERMFELDSEQARMFEMPEGTIEEMGEAYINTSFETIKIYSLAMFKYWTEEAFSSRFRRLLTLEQYKDPEMAELFQRYLAAGPVEYMTDVFSIMTGSDETARQLALEFYGPMYLLYSVYDGMDDKAQALPLLEKHIDRFFSQMTSFPDGSERASAGI